MPTRPASTWSGSTRRRCSSHGTRSASVSGTPAAIFATFCGGCRSSPSARSQPSRPASSPATVDFPQPDTPITTRTVSAHRPGRHFTSPSGFATRARMNSRSESRLRYSSAARLVALRVGLVQRPGAALGAPGQGAGLVQQRRAGRAAGQDEAVELRQVGVELVAPALEPRRRSRPRPAAADIRVGDDRACTGRRRRRTGRSGRAAAPSAIALRQRAEGERDAERGVRLVAVGVGGDPRVGLAHPRHVAERGRAVVAGLGVDAGEMNGHGDPGR